MIILGINAYHGDAAAAIIRDGKIIAAVEEERFNRFKHCAGFPTEAIKYCLQAAGVGIDAVEHIGISRDPSAHLHKKVLFAATRAAKQAAGAGARRQETGPTTRPEAGAGGGTLAAADVISRDNETLSADTNGNGGPGFFRQVKDRLSNAAKVRDLKDVLASSL